MAESVTNMLQHQFIPSYSTIPRFGMDEHESFIPHPWNPDGGSMYGPCMERSSPGVERNSGWRRVRRGRHLDIVVGKDEHYNSRLRDELECRVCFSMRSACIARRAMCSRKMSSCFSRVHEAAHVQIRPNNYPGT
jgi:hypothetical protein